MSAGVTFDELLKWSNEASEFWKAHLEANPALLELPCGIGGTENVQGLVRHIWGVELRWAHRLAGLPDTGPNDWPAGPLDALFDLHRKAAEVNGAAIEDANYDWEAPYTLTAAWLPPEKRTITRRKLMAHALLHGQRHWAQLATLLRTAGYPSDFRGDILLSQALC